MRERIVSKYLTVSAVTAGTTVGALLPAGAHGLIEQVVVRAKSGGGASGDVLISMTGGSNEEDLAYKYTSAPWPFVDSSIAAPFDSRHSGAQPSLILAPAVDGVFAVRIDFRLFI